MPTPALSLHEALEVRNKDTVRNDNPNAQGRNHAPQRTSPQQDGGLLYVSGRCLRPPRKEVWRRRRRLRAFSQQLGWISTALQAAEHPQGLQEGRLGSAEAEKSWEVSARHPGSLRRPNAHLAKSASLS